MCGARCGGAHMGEDAMSRDESVIAGQNFQD